MISGQEIINDEIEVIIPKANVQSKKHYSQKFHFDNVQFIKSNMSLLEDEIAQIKNANLKRVNTLDIHHYAIIYSAIFLFISSIAYLKYKKSKKNKHSNNSSTIVERTISMPELNVKSREYTVYIIHYTYLHNHVSNIFKISFLFFVVLL